MSSPFLRGRQHKLAMLAGQAIAAGIPSAPAEDTPAGQEFAGLRVRLHDQLRQLADVESHQARQPLKAEFAKVFAPWVDGVLAADEAVQDEIVLTCMVWAIDYGDFAEAVRLGEFAMRHGLAMPDRYKRSVACFLREDIAEVAINHPDAVDHALLVKIDQLTAGADMPDAAKAKLHKALGRSWAAKAANFDASADSAPAGGAAAYAEQAIAHFRHALALDKNAGVKKDLEQLLRLARDLDAAADADEQDKAGGDAAGGAATPPAAPKPAPAPAAAKPKPAAAPSKAKKPASAKARKRARAAK